MRRIAVLRSRPLTRMVILSASLFMLARTALLSYQHEPTVHATRHALASGWYRLLPTGAPPQQRIWSTGVYDEDDDRLIVFGGTANRDIATIDTGVVVYDEVWALSLAPGREGWTKLRVSGEGPGPRAAHAGVYDPIADRLIIFGGYDERGSYINLSQTWALSLDAGSESWYPIAGASSPPPRVWSAGVYDAIRHRMILLGGYAPDHNATFADGWALDLTNGQESWSSIGGLDAGRAAHAAYFDDQRDQVVVMGGLSTRGEVLDSTLLIDFSVNPAGSIGRAPVEGPSRRYWADAAFRACPSEPQGVVFGGYDGRLSQGDLWRMGDHWINTSSPGGPRPRDSGVLIYQEAATRLILFGGWDSQGAILKDTWAYDLPCDPGVGLPSATPDRASRTAEATMALPTATPRPSPTAAPYCGDRYEVNDQPSTANTIVVSGSPRSLVQGSGSKLFAQRPNELLIGPPPQQHMFLHAADLDYAVFTVLAHQRYDVHTQDLMLGADTIVQVLAEDGVTKIDSNDDDPSGQFGLRASRILFTASKDGRAYIRVSSASTNVPTCSQTYRLAVRFADREVGLFQRR